MEDARQDIRFADNPLVTGDPDIRFYAGVPLHDASGLVMGTLCAVDREPRRLSSTQEAMLRDIAAMAERELQIVRCWSVSATR